jgi:hypothetical protein
MDNFTSELRQVEDSLNTYLNFVKGYISASEKLDSFYGDEDINIK